MAVFDLYDAGQTIVEAAALGRDPIALLMANHWIPPRDGDRKLAHHSLDC
jgi:hypothetical protein